MKLLSPRMNRIKNVYVMADMPTPPSAKKPFLYLRPNEQMANQLLYPRWPTNCGRTILPVRGLSAHDRRKHRCRPGEYLYHGAKALQALSPHTYKVPLFPAHPNDHHFFKVWD